jgi:hypothetical protein
MTNFPYTRIITYGCSFTAGDELGDAEVLGWTEDELEKYSKKNKVPSSVELFHDFLKLDQSVVKKIYDYNRTLSWPNYVAKHFNVSLVNKARGGGSNEWMIQQYLKDKQLGLFRDTDLILFGLTSPMRWFQFNNKGQELFGVFFQRWPEINDNLQKALTENWLNIYNLAYNFSKSIQFISNESDLNAGRIKMCHAFMNPGTFRAWFNDELNEDPRKLEFFNSVMEMYNKHHILRSNECIANLTHFDETDRRKYQTFGHPTRRYHEIYANLIIEELKTLYV